MRHGALPIYPVVETGFEPWACSALLWGRSGEPGSLLALLLANSVTLGKSLHLSGPLFSNVYTKAWHSMVSKIPASCIPDKECVLDGPTIPVGPSIRHSGHPNPTEICACPCWQPSRHSWAKRTSPERWRRSWRRAASRGTAAWCPCWSCSGVPLSAGRSSLWSSPWPVTSSVASMR